MHDPKLISRRTPTYKKLLEKLPVDIQDLCQTTFNKWKKDNSSVVIKHLDQLGPYAYAAEINRSYRALGYKKKDDIGQMSYIWFWVGSHEDYNNLIKNHQILNQIKKMRNNEHVKPSP